MAVRISAGLHGIVTTEMSGYRFLVRSDREPFLHVEVDDNIGCMRPASGAATAPGPPAVEHNNFDRQAGKMLEAPLRIVIPEAISEYAMDGALS